MSREPNWPTGQYRLTEEAYIGRTPNAMHEVLPEDTVITHNGRPGPHMQPMDEGAKQAVATAEKLGGLGALDPTASLDLTMAPETEKALLLEKNAELEARIAEASARVAAAEPEAEAPAQEAAQPAPNPPPPPPPPPAPPLPPKRG